MAGSSSVQGLINSFLARKRLIGSSTEYRIITPICSALEVQSYKNAIQLCNKQIKKQPDNYVVLALKTLSLSLSSRPVSPAIQQEILAIVEFVKTNANGAGLGDPDVLMFFGWVLGGINKGDETLAVLAKATQRHPENEDVCVEAFLHYVRSGERKSAQQIAMRMQRSFSSQKEKYLWWSIETTLLQVRDPTNPTNDLLLSIAERQLSSYYTTPHSAALSTAPAATPATNGSSRNALEIEAPPAKTPGRDKGKGKGKVVSVSEPSPPATPPTPGTPRAPEPLEYDSSHEFHLVTRFLELRVVQANAKLAAAAGEDAGAVVAAKAAAALPAPAQVVLPSLEPSDVPLSLQRTLLAHFASREAGRWCKQGLGLEIWRRESELKYGSVEGGEWQAAWDRLRKSLEGGDTNWHTMLYLIRITFSVALGSSSSFQGVALPNPCPEPSDAGKELLEQTRALFRTLADNGEKGRKERGFLLALLEIEREGRARSWADVNPLPALVEEYFGRFSTKACCFDDLKPYLEALSDDERQQFLAKTLEIADAATELTSKGVCTLINAAKIARSLVAVSDEETEASAAVKYLARYFEVLPLGKGLVATELQPADDFALLAAQAYVAAWSYSHDRAYIEKAIAILDYAGALSKYKYQLRILVVNLLRLLGAPSLALSHYRILGLKAIQYDTLSHVVLSRAATFAVGTDPGLGDEVTAALKWYRTGEHDASEMPVRAFSYHSYSKIEDFTEFQDRLKSSLSKHIVQVEALRMKVLRGAYDPLATVGGVIEVARVVRGIADNLAMSDNRDYKTLPSLQPAAAKATVWEQTQMGPKTGYAWLRAMTAVYESFLAPLTADAAGVADAGELATSELTASESALLAFSKHARVALSAGLESAEAEQAALVFFKEQDARFAEAIDAATLPWELLHTAEITFEGFLLLDLAVDQKIAEMTVAKIPDHAKLSKGLRTFRTAARELLRVVGSRVSTYSKQVAKQRPKIMANITSLSQFPLLDQDHLTTFAHGLVESRKGTVEALGSAIHKRCSQK